MARYELLDVATAGLGEAPITADTVFELGMMYSSERSRRTWSSRTSPPNCT